MCVYACDGWTACTSNRTLLKPRVNGAMRKKDNNLNRGQVHRNLVYELLPRGVYSKRLREQSASVCVYYLLSHLPLSPCSFAIRGTCAFTVPLQLWQAASERWFYSGGRDIAIAIRLKVKNQTTMPSRIHLLEQDENYAINAHNIEHMSVR